MYIWVQKFENRWFTSHQWLLQFSSYLTVTSLAHVCEYGSAAACFTSQAPILYWNIFWTFCWSTVSRGALILIPTRWRLKLSFWCWPTLSTGDSPTLLGEKCKAPFTSAFTVKLMFWCVFFFFFFSLIPLQGAVSGSVQASDRLMKELREIYRSQSYKTGTCTHTCTHTCTRVWCVKGAHTNSSLSHTQNYITDKFVFWNDLWTWIFFTAFFTADSKEKHFK